MPMPPPPGQSGSAFPPPPGGGGQSGAAPGARQGQMSGGAQGPMAGGAQNGAAGQGQGVNYAQRHKQAVEQWQQNQAAGREAMDQASGGGIFSTIGSALFGGGQKQEQQQPQKQGFFAEAIGLPDKNQQQQGQEVSRGVQKQQELEELRQTDREMAKLDESIVREQTYRSQAQGVDVDHAQDRIDVLMKRRQDLEKQRQQQEWKYKS